MDKYYQDILASIPDSLDFNFITTKTKSTLSFTLNNQSEMSILFRIDNSDSYIFSPPSGVIMRHKKLEITVSITPETAIVLVSNAKITLDDKISKIIKISSISKYPYLTINQTSLDFGVLQMGKSTSQELIITNPESVPAQFEIIKHSEQPGKHPEVFYLSSTSGQIPPYSAFLIKIKYQTIFPGVWSNETYTLNTIGGNSVKFSCFGSCLSLLTWVSTKRVNFGSVVLGNQTNRLIRIYNDSDQLTDFMMFHNNDGAFKINKIEGSIDAHTNLRVTITFKPFETMVYYERIFCLIKNHNLIAIDVYGSCKDLLNKTPLIESKFIDMFRYKILNGMYFNKVDVSQQGKENIEKFSQSSNITKNGHFVNASTGFNAGNSIYSEVTSQIQLHKEMFWETTSNTRVISFDTDFIDFRFVYNRHTSEPYNLKVKNNTNERVKVKWILNKPINTSNLIKTVNLFNIDDCVFIIQPEEAIISKQSTCEFKVYFKPNKSEYYFYSEITCQATILSYSETGNKEVFDITKYKIKSKRKLLKPIQTKTIASFGYQNKLLTTTTSINKAKESSNYFDPPISTKLCVVGHSFPPNNQIFIPMYEILPPREIFFPPSTMKQSLYQTIRITNKSDTPLFYNISPDPLNVFRVHRKCGLIPSRAFHLICIEFCPNDNTVYKYPLRIMLNHDTDNIHTIILNALSVNPVIEIEGVGNEIYFPSCFLGIKSKKEITIINRCPIKVNVNIKVEQNPNAIVEVRPSSFEMSTNLIRKAEITFCPITTEEVNTKIAFIVERIYDSSSESIGIYNPGSLLSKEEKISESPIEDKRPFVKEITVLGKGSDGNLYLSPTELEFGTVKVGFHKKLSFSISNPTMTNFYIKLEVETINDEKNQKDTISFDFTEGEINSLCKREVNVTFKPNTRSAMNLIVKVIATENPEDKETLELLRQSSFTPHNSPKSVLSIKANGDYPLIKIADIRNDSVGTCALWHLFNVDKANEELQKQLNDEEINYITNDTANKKIKEFTDKLKCIKFDFGKHVKKKNAKNYNFDVFLTLKNEGGVASEFYFKFPDDFATKREIWMDPVEPTSNDKVEYRVVKEKIFEIEPRRSKLEPNQCCNIRFRYNKKEKGNHRLRVLFQIVHGKPLIFELFAQCYGENQGILEIRRPEIDFNYVPIGYMSYLVSPIELSNVGGAKIRYNINKQDLDVYNEQNSHFKIFLIDNMEGSIGPGDVKYLPVYFRPITNKQYVLNLKVYSSDEVMSFSSIPITIKGIGYHPLHLIPPLQSSPFEKMPKDRMSNELNGELIQKCGVSVEEIDFGSLREETVTKTFILYNFSKTTSFIFDFKEPGFILNDEMEIKPSKDKLEPNSHVFIKLMLTPKGSASNYQGEIEINITWNTENSNKVLDKEKLHIRIRKHSLFKEVPGRIDQTENNNQCFVETILTDLTREILSSNDFQDMLINNLTKQPLGIYDWTNDKAYRSQKEVRKDLKENFDRKAKTIIGHEIGIAPPVLMKRSIIKRSTRRGSENFVPTMLMFGEELDYIIQDKYMSELLTKYKITLPEVNESLAVVNEESRKLIRNEIMDTTVYNIISEAVYGESDLTEKTRIYFFNK